VLQSLAGAPDWRALAESWSDGGIKFALTRALLALRTELSELFAYGAYRPLVVTGPHREEFVAFARVHGADAVIVVAGRLFARASDKGRRWPARDAWDASISVGNFSELRDAIALETSHAGPQLAIKDLFAQIPVAVLRARYAPAKANRARARSPALAT
jgi:(1->4)-alpha-D-glucan 1-alpha-D-glucosylmutase